jgi:MFS family permease
MNSLIAFRVVQAIGGGMIFPAALSEVSSAVPAKSRGMAMGIMMAINAVAAIIGPNLGGFLVEHFGWRYVFYINPPIGIVAILLALKFTETYGAEKHSIDFVGAGLLGGTLLAFMFGVIRLGDLPLTDITVGGLFVLAVVLGIALIVWERRVKEPIISVPLLARGDILALNLRPWPSGSASSPWYCISRRTPRPSSRWASRTAARSSHR